MEKSKPETEHDGQPKVQEPEQVSNPKDSSGHVPNGGGNAAGVVKGSASQSESESQVPTGQSMKRTSSSGSMKKSVHWSPELVTESTFVSSPRESHPYISLSPMSQPSFNVKETVDIIRNVLGRWGRKMGEATKKAENLAGNTWQHLKTSPSFAEAAMGRIAQGTKVLVEGGYDKIFHQTFETVPDEQLQNSYACYLSTSAGPVMGVLYLSTAKLAYCSDNPISYKNDNNLTEWSYYKLVIPLHQLKAVSTSSNGVNPAEKYIQVISNDNHEFWFMGFLNYEGAVDSMQEAFNANKLE